MEDPPAEDEDLRDEGYETKRGHYVIFDSKNPLAWIKSSIYLRPPDSGDGEAEGEGEESPPD